MLELFLKGFIIGFAIAAPVGPIGVLCIQRSLHNGFGVGLMTGLGAALADGVYGLIAGFGLTAVSHFLIKEQVWIRVIGGLFLIYLGIKTACASPCQQTASRLDRSPWHACGTTFLLTLTSPLTILSFIAVFSGLGLGSTNTHYTYALALVLGITLGSGAWWFLLSGGVAFILHHRITPRIMRIINAVSGAIILACGVFSLKM